MLFLETLVVLKSQSYLSITIEMHEIFQKTIDSPISFEGISLHSGKKSKIMVKPGTEDQGIIFKRTDGISQISKIYFIYIHKYYLPSL